MRLFGRYSCNPCKWKEGAIKQIAFDAIAPLFIVPILTVIASLCLTCTLLVILVVLLFIYCIYRRLFSFQTRTKFFLMWTITSILMLMIIFEVAVVPLLEILPEENYVFMFCVVSGLACGYKTKKCADNESQENKTVKDLEASESQKEICNICRRYKQEQTFHCQICQICIMGREYHCKWLDCCIGTSNLRWYLACLLFSAIAFIYGSNLAMTSVCHPFILVGTILLPDNCSDAYYQLDIAVCFVSSIYSLFIGLVVFCYLFYHLWLQLLGQTTNGILGDNEDLQNKATLKNVVKCLC